MSSGTVDEQRRQELLGHRMNPERQRPRREGGFGQHTVADLEDEPDAPLRDDLLRHEDVQLGADRLVLNLIVRVVKERHERQRRFERRRVLEQAYGPQSSVAVWTLEIRDRRIRAGLRMDIERRGQQRQGREQNEMSCNLPYLPAA